MQVIHSPRYGASWILACAVLMMVMVWTIWLPGPPPQPHKITEHTLKDRLIPLLDEDLKLNKEWLSRSQQTELTWSDAPQESRDVLQAVWGQLLNDVQAVQAISAQLLQPESINKTRAWLQPYLKSTHPETSRQALELDKHLQGLLQHVNSEELPPQLELSWVTLGEVTGHVDQIQPAILGVRRLSRLVSVPYGAKFSIQFSNRLLTIFPGAQMREFENLARRIVEQRWVLLYLLEKSFPPESDDLPSPQPPMSPAWFWGAALMVLPGVVGIYLLTRQSGELRDAQNQLKEHAQTAQVMQERLAKMQSPDVRQQTAVDAAPGNAWPPNFAQDISELRGKIKRIQLRFDTGQSLEIALQDLEVLDDKFRQWEQMSARQGAEGSRDV